MVKAKRLTISETWAHLESRGEKMPRNPDGRPFVPPRMPNYEDEALGFSFFGQGGNNNGYANLTLPHTYFGRSTLTRLSFANSYLFESRMCWNDFVECDFSGADLSGCDMRASLFTNCSFVDAILLGVDLRKSTFEDCDFTGAELTGAVAVEEDAIGCLQDSLSDEQWEVVVWMPDGGPEPPGG